MINFIAFRSKFFEIWNDWAHPLNYTEACLFQPYSVFTYMVLEIRILEITETDTKSHLVRWKIKS